MGLRILPRLMFVYQFTPLLHTYISFRVVVAFGAWVSGLIWDPSPDEHAARRQGILRGGVQDEQWPPVEGCVDDYYMSAWHINRHTQIATEQPLIIKLGTP
ncbi:hypothetical protein L798_01482 [Zootermopsis nevadensis]|uniref:Uncharacterized protein n=1 Tax=Zootermopsis nevadensis TaxID=136037 RepID=A0A067QTB6_ZOONE|nr:hypothetical protein L798_01482 [Zootermopsis nevadensis]